MAGEVELATQRSLAYLLGHDATGLFGRQIVDRFAQRRPFRSGRYYFPPYYAQTSGGTNPGINSIRLFPIFLPQPVTINALAARVTTLFVGGNIQLAIYAADSTTDMPSGNPLASTGSLSTTSLATVTTSVSNASLSADLVWGASNCDNATAIFTSGATTAGHTGAQIGSTTAANVMSSGAGTLSGLSYAQTFGSWPDLTGSSIGVNLTELVGVNTVPLIAFKVA